MSDSYNKYQLNVLIRQNTRLKLSRIFEDKYQDKYPSFSQFIEYILIKGIDEWGIIMTETPRYYVLKCATRGHHYSRMEKSKKEGEYNYYLDYCDESFDSDDNSITGIAAFWHTSSLDDEPNEKFRVLDFFLFLKVCPSVFCMFEGVFVLLF
jgi:hypothetical protein